jgi:YegS/Rv2252/BmrU family lipid kinase
VERPVCLIVNPHAGGGRAAKQLPAVEAALRELGVEPRVRQTAGLDHARELAAAALDAEETVVAMGGDGLVGAVAGVVCARDGVLGVLPGGRGNDFARKLGIPADPALACSVLAGGAEKRVDVADADGATYLGIASAGIDSDVQVIANATRLPLGGQVYAYGVLRALATWKPARWKVWADGAERSFAGYSVAVANSGVFGGGMALVPDASLHDGLLDVVLTSDVPKRRYLANLPRVFRGTHLDEPGLELLQAREVRFQADRPFAVYADGDPIAALPCRIRVVPGALRVLAPA